MKAAVQEKPLAATALDMHRVRELVLLRIACAGNGVSRSELASDLTPFVMHRIAAARWRSMLDGEIHALAATGLISIDGSRVRSSDAGVAKAAGWLGIRGAYAGAWPQLTEVRLVARALGMQRESAKRLLALATPEGLRAAILQRAYNLRIKGVATASRLRAALAGVALQRAFGNQVGLGLSGKSALPAKASRLLAAQLSRRPRDFGTDARLIAALAAEHVGAARPDFPSLRLATIRRYLEEPAKAPPARRQRLAESAPRLVRPVQIETVALDPTPSTPAPRPDLAGFAQEVRRHAASRAQGWSGDRKAYISHVWRALSEQRPDWGLSEIEFKCMLAEAHRAGQLALANADLKDADNIKDLQESAVLYRNAIFHFVRVES